MKFKSLFITFNIVLFLSFLTIFFLPFFILGSEFLFEFWVANWYFCLFFLLILAIVNFLFIVNWKTLTFLEKEDWPALAQHLEITVIEKKHYRKRQVGLLCDSLMLLGDFETLRTLEILLRTERPRILSSLGVRFAAGKLLAADFEELFRFASALSTEKGADSDWLRFYAAFSRHLAKKYTEAFELFVPLSSSAKDPLVIALSGYMCGCILAPILDEKEASLGLIVSSTAKDLLVHAFTSSKWQAYIEESKSEMHVVVLGKLIGETGLWLYKK